MPHDNPINRLDQILARLYPTEDEARRVAAKAGVPLAFVKFSGNALVVWFAVIQEADKRNQKGSLIDAALEEYPDDPELLEAKAQASSSVRAPKSISDGRHEPVVLPPQADQTAELDRQSRSRNDVLMGRPSAPESAGGHAPVRNPWISGSFYLVVLVVLTCLVAGLSLVFIRAGIPAAGAVTSVLAIVLACAGGLVIVGTVQQTQDDKITPENALRRIELGFQAMRQAIKPTSSVEPVHPTAQPAEPSNPAKPASQKEKTKSG